MQSIFSMLLAVFGLAALANACAAPENKDSPPSVYAALFLSDHALGALVFFPLDGYVNVGIALGELPGKQGPFSYSLQTKKVPKAGCASLKDIFNPFCGTLDARTPAEKEVGDLSGKHGLIRGDTEVDLFEDRYTSLNKKNLAYIGGLSVVITDAKGNNIACADIEEISSPLSGDKAKAAAGATKLDLPQDVKALLA